MIEHRERKDNLSVESNKEKKQGDQVIKSVNKGKLKIQNKSTLFRLRRMFKSQSKVSKIETVNRLSSQ